MLEVFAHKPLVCGSFLIAEELSKVGENGSGTPSGRRGLIGVVLVTGEPRRAVELPMIVLTPAARPGRLLAFPPLRIDIGILLTSLLAFFLVPGAVLPLDPGSRLVCLAYVNSQMIGKLLASEGLAYLRFSGRHK